MKRNKDQVCISRNEFVAVCLMCQTILSLTGDASDFAITLTDCFEEAIFGDELSVEAIERYTKMVDEVKNEVIRNVTN